ncbi:MAG: DUF4325 domain-containing protein [Candidatus Omnitrophica bacterium]|nr:DUF4325 domain-containing protein [Candidatus Omnitrophota bacterium]MBU1127795.1 DUF4325 domain-containing protein [Candidatus Omnitrophota bacterium]MBU1656686.1 DUF4325 domain-containing protein [Candidatus Omnitrophota bacterium]MBU1784656.1 DUF4325 domain-containing protein [Candidatus Omnitrophota bacterium]MBU1852268.1 DUF4325 domain-containing protein [Candidatus Omnitrophota bacterium]
MDIRSTIKEALDNNGSVTVADIVRATGFSRAYVHRLFSRLIDEGEIVLIGKANTAHYVPANKEIIARELSRVCKAHLLKIRSNDLREDGVLDEITKKTGIFTDIKDNVAGIVKYAFLEMVNNAIEHSRSETIDIYVEKTQDKIKFRVNDNGVGIFNNIMEKRGFADYDEAINRLLKGKETTDPKGHSGEGIFFTSKAADTFVIRSARKKLLYDNLIEDIFIRRGKYIRGTKIMFSVSLDSTRNVDDIFRKYTNESYDFGKTEVVIKLYQGDAPYIARSQARRILTNLDKFKIVIMDFKDTDTVGQGFADEVFRVWQNAHKDIEITVKNANENVAFMINRAKSG